MFANTKLQHVNRKILETIEKTIDSYLMLRSEEVIIAFSGGKDSFFTTVALHQLGYKVVPVVVDMGYENNWGARIIELANAHGIRAYTIPIRNDDFKNLLPSRNLKDFEKRLTILNNIGILTNDKITPCTQCYNIKIIAIEAFALKRGIKTIVFGHHGTDAVTSLLKSALMFIDRWENMHTTFSRRNYEILVESVKHYFLNGTKHLLSSSFFEKIERLTDMQFAATDEPPVQYIRNSYISLKIVRPLFNIFEYSIKEYQAEHSLKTEGSGCGHGATKATQTPREMVHRRIFDELPNNRDCHRIQEQLLVLAKKGIAKDGTLKLNVRNKRAELLGPNYKSGHALFKKL